MRNINQVNELCNGTRLKVRRMENNVVECSGGARKKYSAGPLKIVIYKLDTKLFCMQKKYFVYKVT
jgi:hypothetical protein